jgi:DNA phosphorothioation-associated putative methyltransferase
MRRYRCSKPVSVALADGIINSATSVFDYGCGYGGDVRYLCSKKIRARGWDPHYHPDESVGSADVVNLGYVLNVIEDTRERPDTLRRAFELAKIALVVAVRVDRTLEEAVEFGDGRLTGAGTFQKLYSQEEFRAYVESVLGRHVYLAAPGIAYVFADDGAEARYLGTRAFTRRLEYRTDLIAEFSRDRLARRYVGLANRLGRLPAPDEFPQWQKLLIRFGSVHRVERLVLRQVDCESFQGSREQRREDVLTYIAMLRLQGLVPPPLHALPLGVRKDVVGIWRTYKAALSEGEWFLFSIGDTKAVRAACGSSKVGKLLPEDLYVHKSAEHELPALLRLLIFAGWLIVGEIAYDVVKIAIDGRALSFLRYPDFDVDAHPALTRSVRVYLPRAKFSVRDYRGVNDPPVLHRKETMVTRDYPYFDTFKRLTEEEESVGLLSGSNIGFRNGWNLLLRERGMFVSDHSLLRIPN